MRIRLAAILLLSCLSLGAQPDRDRLVLRGVPVREAIDAVHSWSGCSFLWESHDLDASVTVDVDAYSLEEALDQIFAGQDVSYIMRGNVVVVSRPARKEEGSPERVTGYVRDDGGNPVEGAVVLNTLTSKGVLTLADGSFHLDIPEGIPLSFTCLGFDTVELPSSSMMEVTLHESAAAIAESVLIGYGTKERTYVTGAISTLSSSDFSGRTSPTLGHILQGEVPGMFVQSFSGNPSDVPFLTVRGVPSLNGGEPLVLIDGVEGDLSKVNSADVHSVSVIKDASSSAVYGAKASFGVILVSTKSGYSGARRPTVKYTGRTGFASPTTRTDYETRGYDSVYLSDLFMKESTGRAYTFYTASDMEMLRARREDRRESPDRPWIITEERDGRMSYLYYCNTDWYHGMYRDINPVQSHNISVSGGSGPVKYYLSGGYDHKEGTFRSRAEQYDRYNVLSKTDFEIVPGLTLSNRMSFYSSSYDYPGNRSPDYTFGFSSVHGLASFPLQNPDGTWVYRTIFNDFNLANGCHIELGADAKRNKVDYYSFSDTVSLLVTRGSSLELHADASFTLDSERECFRWAGMEYSLYPGEVTREETGRFMNRLEDYIYLRPESDASLWGKYSLPLPKEHDLSFTAGFNARSVSWKNIYTYADNIGSDTVSDYNLKQADGDGNFRTDVQGGQSRHNTAGFFGRAEYSFRERYLLELSGRLDGSSAFMEGSRWGFFPSVSAAWIFTREPSFAAVLSPLLSFGKVRVSMGQLGNQQVSDFQYMRTVSLRPMDYLFGNGQNRPLGAYLSAPNASDLTWETIRHFDVGADVSMLGGKFGATFDFYIRDTMDMLTEGEDLPSVYGAPSPLENRADLRSSGYEITLVWSDRFSLGNKPFKWGLKTSLTDYTTRITRFGNAAKVLGSHYVGETIGEIWGFTVDGLFRDDDQARSYTDYASGGIDQSLLSGGLRGGWMGGDLKFRDLDGDRIISKGGYTVDDPGDLRVIGNSLPRYQFGLTFTASWSGFDLTAFFQGIGRMNWYPGADNTAFWGPYSRPYGTFYQKDFLEKCWTPSNRDAYFPRTRGMIAMEGTTELTEPNDRYLQNLGYVRLKNLTLGWSLPSSRARKAGLSAVRFYITGENLMYLSPLSKATEYMDPEALYVNGAYGYTYPWQRLLSLGADITF